MTLVRSRDMVFLLNLRLYRVQRPEEAEQRTGAVVQNVYWTKPWAGILYTVDKKKAGEQAMSDEM
jgi:hypothetical protein